MDQVAERLAELRERRALTLRELAQMSGVAADTINQIELGHRKARPSTLRKLARALEIDVQEFYAEPALPKAEAPREAGQSSAERATIIEALAASVDSVADRTQTRLDETDNLDGDALVALMEDSWLAHRGAEQLLAEVAEEAMQQQRETPGERRARSKLEDAVIRLTNLSENIASGLMEGTAELEWAEEHAKLLHLDEERRRRRAS
jgi:transcriptional regulator with XRE-family HTH domain